MHDYDVIIIGAGIAGTSLAYELAHGAGSFSGQSSGNNDQRILVLEQEFAPGYHATGRSAAFWAQTYGGPFIEPLTSASSDFLKTPPKDFHNSSFLNNRGAINIARHDQKHLADQMIANFISNEVDLSLVNFDFINAYVNGLKSDWNIAVWEPECSDIDVAALHGAYMRNAKKQGVEILCSAQFEAAQYENGLWNVQSAKGQFSSKTLVNAAGAWADDVAVKSQVQPQNINPYRRTMVELELDAKAPHSLPLIVAIDGSFYFKAMPGGNIWLSPHDETACPASDVAPEEIDIAIAIDRFQNVVDWKVKKIVNKWAGLRSFAPDRLPVIGFDANNYFWFVGQGGFGIQTSPATAKIAAHKILHHDNSGGAMPDMMKHIDGSKYRPNRF